MAKSLSQDLTIATADPQIQTTLGDFLTTVSNADAAGKPVDVGITSPSVYVDEEVWRVLNSEAKGESVHANV